MPQRIGRGGRVDGLMDFPQHLNVGDFSDAKEFSMWMAGGDVKGGFRYGATDEHGIAAVKDPMHINDMHATMLYLLGLDHERLTNRYIGRDFRLTDAIAPRPRLYGREAIANPREKRIIEG
jgi:hypothetical protein